MMNFPDEKRLTGAKHSERHCSQNTFTNASFSPGNIFLKIPRYKIHQFVARQLFF